MATIHDVPVNELIERIAKELSSSGAVTAPGWAMYVKTGVHKERPPMQADWWHIRSAAMLRKISIKGPIGVSKLRRLYGGKRNMGMAPERVFKGSGAIIRKILQQLDKAGLTRHTKVGLHFGRVITPKGRSLLDKTSTQLAKELGITIKPSPRTEHTPSLPQSEESEGESHGSRTSEEAGEDKRQAKKKPAKKE